MGEGVVRLSELEELILRVVVRGSKGDIGGMKQVQYSGLRNTLVKLRSILPQLD